MLPTVIVFKPMPDYEFWFNHLPPSQYKYIVDHLTSENIGYADIPKEAYELHLKNYWRSRTDWPPFKFSRP